MMEEERVVVYSCIHSCRSVQVQWEWCSSVAEITAVDEGSMGIVGKRMFLAKLSLAPENHVVWGNIGRVVSTTWN
jgi:hypothetical protein